VGGVTVYGTIDIGAAYMNNGAPLSGSFPTGIAYYPGKNDGKTVASFAPNGLSQSTIGIKVEEAIGGGWVALGRADTGFLPTSGELADACASMVRASGKNVNQQITNGDSSRCGQAFNGQVYAGLSNSTYGTLTIGRQNSLQLDTIASYDPQGLSYAFSLIGFSGFNAGGGDTQAARWDNALKYVYQYGPLHAGVMYTNGGQDTGVQNGAYGFNIGGKYKGLSVDAVYAKERGAVGASPLSTIDATHPLGTLSATISDNEMWSVEGKYTFEFGGGYKDEGPASKLTLYAGYENVTLSNPKDTVAVNSTIQGGYVASSVSNGAFVTDRVDQFFWTGAKYELASGWSFTGAYYHQEQNSFTNASGTCAANTTAAHGVKAANCSGALDSGSFVVDYQFNKHFDVYTGVQYGELSGGKANGFLNDNWTTVMSGVRLKF
jgi:predicted porin